MHAIATRGSIAAFNLLLNSCQRGVCGLLFERSKEGWLPLHQAFNKTDDGRAGGELAARRRLAPQLMAAMRAARPDFEVDGAIDGWVGGAPAGFDQHGDVGAYEELVRSYSTAAAGPSVEAILGDQLRASVAPADYPRVREAVLALRRDVQTGRVPMSREEFVEGVVRIIERRGEP